MRGKGTRGGGLSSCQANTIWEAHWCYWEPRAVPRIHMIMKQRAIQSADLKLGLRAFASPQQPVACIPRAQPAFLPGTNHLFDFPRACERQRSGEEGGGGEGPAKECLPPILSLSVYFPFTSSL